MLRLLVLLSLGVFLSCGAASADYDSCVSKSEKVFNGCMEKANKLVNDIEIQDAKALCNDQFQAARSTCDQEEINKGLPVPPDSNPQQ